LVSNLSAATNAMIPVVVNREKPVVLMASLTSLSALTTASQYVFRYFLSSEDEVKRMTAYLRQNQIAEIGLAYLNDDFGKDAVALFKASFSGKILHEETYAPDDKDFKALSAKVRDLEHLYLLGFGPTYGLLIKQLRENGYKGRIYAFSSLGAANVLAVAGEAATGAVFTGASFNPTDPVTEAEKMFIQSYKGKFEKLPDHYAAYGYDIGVMLLKVASGKSKSPEQLKNDLLSLGQFEGVFGKTSVDKTGDFHFDVKLYEVLTGGQTRRIP